MLYCRACNDFIYHTKCYEIAETQLRKEARALNKSVSWRPWIIKINSIRALFAFPTRRILHDRSTIGLRGLYNLGSTCFMNSIIQALIHTPMLQRYFLAQRHMCTVAMRDQCLVCELSTLFQDFYSGDTKPLSLHRMLNLIWNQCSQMAGYEQKDAHEFFIATLDLLHDSFASTLLRKEKGIELAPKNKAPTRCSCIIDQIFTGRLQSDVVCQACKNVSTTIDPFWDISLDLGEVQPGSGPPKSLSECLERFTLPENLGSSAKIKCNNCNSYQESTKQLSMGTLPIVASFHLKRFEHNTQVNRKISTSIEFPDELDMTPFMARRTERSGDCRYSLYAVINHVGTLDNGHYTAFIRHHKNLWVKCDDHALSVASLQDVLASEGYVQHKHISLFYIC